MVNPAGAQIFLCKFSGLLEQWPDFKQNHHFSLRIFSLAVGSETMLQFVLWCCYLQNALPSVIRHFPTPCKQCHKYAGLHVICLNVHQSSLKVSIATCTIRKHANLAWRLSPNVLINLPITGRFKESFNSCVIYNNSSISLVIWPGRICRCS